MTFPPRALRDVRVCYTQPSCMGGTADITVDFEPLPGGALGFEFVDAVDWTGSADELIPLEELRDCADKVGEGILLNLLGMPREQMVPDTVRGHRFQFPLSDTGASGTLTQALSQGVPLCGDAHRPLIAVRIVLRRARHHIVDSGPAIFRRAGHRAAHKAIRQIDGIAFDRDPKDRA